MNGTPAMTRSLVLLGPKGDKADIGLQSKESKCNEKVGTHKDIRDPMAQE
jgi:hypothetical protein